MGKNRGLIGTLNQWLDGGEPETPTRGAAKQPGASPQQTATDTQKSQAKDFEASLKAAIAGGDAFAGRLKILNLEHVRERLGAKWDSLEGRIHKHIDLLLELRLGPDDRYFRYGSAQYYLLFGSDDSDAAEEKIAALAEEIVAKVLGTDAVLSDLEVGTSVTDLKEVDGADALANVASALAGVDQTTHEASFGGSKAPLDDDWLERLREMIEEARAELDRLFRSGRQTELDAALVARSSTLMKIIKTAGSEIAKLGPTLSNGKNHRRVAAAMPGAEEFGHPPVGLTSAEEAALFRLLDSIVPTPKNLAFQYLPVWSPAQGVVSVFGGQAVAVYASHSKPFESMRGLREKADHLNLIDCITLKRAVLDLRRMEQEGAVSVISVPVHILTLSRPSSATEFLGICRSIAKKFRRLIVWEILGADPNSWSSHLLQQAARLAPFGRGVTFRLPVSRRDLGELAGPGVIGVSTKAPARWPDAPDQIDALRAFAARAKEHKLTVNVWDVHDPELAEAVIAVGADTIRGNAVGGPRPRPSQMVRLGVEAVTGRAAG